MRKYIQIISRDEDRARFHGESIFDNMFEHGKITKKLEVYQVRFIGQNNNGDNLYKVYAKSK